MTISPNMLLNYISRVKYVNFKNSSQIKLEVFKNGQIRPVDVGCIACEMHHKIERVKTIFLK